MTSALPDIYKRTWHTFLLYVAVDVISKKKGKKDPMVMILRFCVISITLFTCASL